MSAGLLAPLLGIGSAIASIALAPKPVKPPPVPDPVRQPDPDSPQLIADTRQRVAQRRQASGRSSTFLDQGDTSYLNTTLGS